MPTSIEYGITAMLFASAIWTVAWAYRVFVGVMPVSRHQELDDDLGD